MRERWPALHIPEYLQGVFAKGAGVVRVKKAFEACRKMSEKRGGEFRYNSMVTNIDHMNGVVTLSTGETFKAKQIVVSSGINSEKFYQREKQFDHKAQLVGTVLLASSSGLPCNFMMEDHKLGFGENLIFGTIEGENLD